MQEGPAVGCSDGNVEACEAQGQDGSGQYTCGRPGEASNHGTHAEIALGSGADGSWESAQLEEWKVVVPGRTWILKDRNTECPEAGGTAMERPTERSRGKGGPRVGQTDWIQSIWKQGQ